MYLNFETDKWLGMVHTETYEIIAREQSHFVMPRTKKLNANDKFDPWRLNTDEDDIIIAAREVLAENKKWGFRKGDIVKIRPEWRDSPKEAEHIHVVTDVNCATKRCYITWVNTDLPLKPSSLVGFEMIEKIGEIDDDSTRA